MGSCRLHGLYYRELVPVQEAAGCKDERQTYNLGSVVGCLGKKLASSNSSKSWHGVSFSYMPRIAGSALLSKSSANNNSKNNNNYHILSSALCQPLSRIKCILPLNSYTNCVKLTFILEEDPGAQGHEQSLHRWGWDSYWPHAKGLSELLGT